MGSFLNLLCEICGAERARLRVILVDENRPIIVLEERMPADGRRSFSGERASAQIPLLESSGGGGESFSPHPAHAHSVCGEADPANGELLESDGFKEWKLARSVDGFQLELKLVLHERSVGFINERISNAAALLDLFESMLDGRHFTLHRHMSDFGAGAAFNPPLIGEAPALVDLKRKVAAVSLTDITLLVDGESGTGKEVVAQNVHRLSRRHARPLVIAGSMEMPHSLLQSELFGHAEGSFTGASRDRAGLIESANGGTFFLDEIGEMPLSLQASLLRVLQEKEVRRLGESKRRAVDVRFVFATNRDLLDLVRRGRFRKDLYFRIAAVRLSIPPLRTRKEDIVPLACYFLERCAEQSKLRAPSLTPAAVKRLVRYHWPGNVRELKNEMECLVALNGGSRIIAPEMLSPHIGEPHGEQPCTDERDGGTLPDAVRRLERAMIREALRRFAGNRTKAAGALGITRQGLLKKLKRYEALEEPRAALSP